MVQVLDTFLKMNKTTEKILLIIYFILVALLGVAFDFSYLVSTLLFFVIPSLYVTVKRPELFKTLSVYAVAIGIPFALIIDAIGLYNHAWWETTVFPIRIFGLVTFDTILWAILYAYTIPALYEYFFIKRNIISLPKKFWQFEFYLLIILTIFIFAFSVHPDWFAIPYFYTIFVGLFYVLTCIVGLINRPKEFSKLLMQCLFFSTLLFIGEIGALAAHQWGFSGNEYLGMIHIGELTFPFEEMIWILVGVPAFLYVYLRLTDRSKS